MLTTLEATYYRAVAALYARRLGDGARGVQRGVRVRGVGRGQRHQVQVVRHPRAPLARGARLRQGEGPARPVDALLAERQRHGAGAGAEGAELVRARRITTTRCISSRKRSALFDENKPFFNSYFFRNALLFCGAIHFDRQRLRAGRVVLPAAWSATSTRARSTSSTRSRTSAASTTPQERYQDAVSVVREGRADPPLQRERVRRRHLVLDRPLPPAAERRRAPRASTSRRSPPPTCATRRSRRRSSCCSASHDLRRVRSAGHDGAPGGRRSAAGGVARSNTPRRR